MSLFLFIFFGSSFIVLLIFVGIFIRFLCIVIWLFFGNFFICINGIRGDINFFLSFVRFCNFLGMYGNFNLFLIEYGGILLFFKYFLYCIYIYFLFLIFVIEVV